MSAAGNMTVPVGKIVYTQFLNSRGGIEADVTVTRLIETAYPRRHPGRDAACGPDLADAPSRAIATW